MLFFSCREIGLRSSTEVPSHGPWGQQGKIQGKLTNVYIMRMRWLVSPTQSGRFFRRMLRHMMGCPHRQCFWDMMGYVIADNILYFNMLLMILLNGQ